MTEFAYDVSGPLRPGGTLLVRNNGQQTHMMMMGRLRDGATLEDAVPVDTSPVTRASSSRSVRRATT